MPLRFEPDVTVADWYTRSRDSWIQLCCIGPSGFASYGRIFHPLQRGGDENRLDDLVNIEGHLDSEPLDRLVSLFAQHTTTPNDCFFGLWDGFGVVHGSPSVGISIASSRKDQDPPTRIDPQIPPAFPPEVMSGPRVRIPNRDYLLFRGPLSEAGQWGAVDLAPGYPRPINSPNLMWPADRAWFAATEIDKPWTGFGGTAALLEAVLADPVLDAEPVNAQGKLPYWRS